MTRRVRPAISAGSLVSVEGYYAGGKLNYPTLEADGAALPLHGDLWHGNVYFAREGPALLDPSFFVGERGVDLAMMRLFGGFPRRFWEVYGELYPVPEEVERALPRYQVYYLLAHVHFFGQGYLGALWRAISAS